MRPFRRVLDRGDVAITLALAAQLGAPVQGSHYGALPPELDFVSLLDAVRDFLA